MNKSICDISGKSPAVPVEIRADGRVVLTLDLSEQEIANLVDGIRAKMTVVDIQPVMKKE